ncbi:MAG: glycosyltransferase [Peptostreptococcaceae bacterium]
MNLTLTDYLFLMSMTAIWATLALNIVLAINGYIYYFKSLNFKDEKLDEYPFVSILVPAHNEGMVIGKTVESLLLLDYPIDKRELIVINDNSSDDSAKILSEIKHRYKNYDFTIINTDSITGGKGKSNALNIGYELTKGEYIAIYDADNTPERTALRYLIQTIVRDDNLGAVIGKFRTRNKKRNILTKFINIETLSFQWIAQAGRKNLLGLCTIPGTNFVLRKSTIEKIGGWDPNAIAEDTEISLRIYKLGQSITYVPQSVTWEQEPETVKIWIKQRTRWVKGNIYVVLKYMKTLFEGKQNKAMFDILYFFSVYFLFLFSVVVSDVIFILGLFNIVEITIPFNFLLVWLLSYILFILQVSITLTMEKGEGGLQNILLVALMYFTYSQLWLFVAIKGMIDHTKDVLFKREVKWYKTERF